MKSRAVYYSLFPSAEHTMKKLQGSNITLPLYNEGNSLFNVVLEY